MHFRIPVFVAFVLASSSALAAPPAQKADPDANASEQPKLALDVAPAFVLPVGNLSDAASVGFGGFVGLHRPIVKQLDVVARAGFVYHLSKDFGGGSAGISEVPILGGVRYTFVPTSDGGFYGGAELGLSIVFARATTNAVGSFVGAQTATQTDTKGSAALSLGYQLGKLDLRGSTYFIDLGHLGDTMTVMATVGYAFAEL